MVKRRLCSRLVGDEIITFGYKALTFAKCTIIMIVDPTVMSGLGSSRDYMVWV
jgi:hypothetical protein